MENQKKVSFTDEIDEHFKANKRYIVDYFL